MPIWKITDNVPQPVATTELRQEDLLEEHLENWIMANPAVIGEPLLILGRQVMIPNIRDRIDVLALDPQGNSVVIELKRGQLADPVDMQALRYASYISKWTFADFEHQARLHANAVGDPSFNFNEQFERFCSDAGLDEVPDLNTDQRIIIVGTEVRAKLGSVALWLLEHNIDIKVIQLEVFREGRTLFLDPQVIIPLPVSRFSQTGATTVDTGKPWRENGRSWHLEKRCSPQTSEIFRQLDDLIRDNFEVDGPRWNQKLCVAYRIGSYNWLAVNTSATMLRLDFLVKAGSFDGTEVANRLDVREFDESDSLADKLEYPSSVLVKQRNEKWDQIFFRIKEGFDLQSEAFLAFMHDAYDAFPH